MPGNLLATYWQLTGNLLATYWLWQLWDGVLADAQGQNQDKDHSQVIK